MSKQAPPTNPADGLAKTGNSDFWTAVGTLVWKDLRIEQHTRQTLSIMVTFSLITVVMFQFALSNDLGAARELSTGLLWTTIILAGTLGLNRSLALDRENQSIDALLIAPVDRRAIYLAKVISVTVFTLLLELILVFVFTIFFNKPFWQPLLLLVIFLGTVGYVAAGVLITSMSMQTRANDVLLPVLLLPLILPLILPAAIASAEIISQQPEWSLISSSISLLLAYNLAILAVGIASYHHVIES